MLLSSVACQNSINVKRVSIYTHGLFDSVTEKVAYT